MAENFSEVVRLSLENSKAFSLLHHTCTWFLRRLQLFECLMKIKEIYASRLCIIKKIITIIIFWCWKHFCPCLFGEFQWNCKTRQDIEVWKVSRDQGGTISGVLKYFKRMEDAGLESKNFIGSATGILRGRQDICLIILQFFHYCHHECHSCLVREFKPSKESVARWRQCYDRANVEIKCFI